MRRYSRRSPNDGPAAHGSSGQTVSLPPINPATRKKVIEGLNHYTSTLLRERKALLRKYHM